MLFLKSENSAVVGHFGSPGSVKGKENTQLIRRLNVLNVKRLMIFAKRFAIKIKMLEIYKYTFLAF